MLCARSKPPRNVMAIVAVFLAIPPSGSADVIVGTSDLLYGHIAAISSEGVQIATGCQAGSPTFIKWDQIRSVVFDDNCQPHNVNPPSAGLLPCNEQRQSLFRVYSATDDSSTYGTGVKLRGDKLQVALPSTRGLIVGAKTGVSAIARQQVCPSSLAQQATSLPGFCLEPFQVAVNWSLEPAMPNTVFSRGFALFVERLPPQSDGPELDSRGAMQTALTVWTSGLLKYRKELGPEVNAFLAKSVSRSEHFMLLVAPQVIKIACQDNANLIVRLSFARGGDFSRSDADYLAKSQIEGRTVLINAADHKFSYSLSRKTEPGAFDLVTVFAHELGHSFGLPDKYLGPSIASIMNPDKLAPECTEEDAKDLAKALAKSLQGTSAGYFNATQCGGLRIRAMGAR